MCTTKIHCCHLSYQWRYRVFIIYCGFSKILNYIPDSGLSGFPLGVSVCTQWQVEHQRCSRTCRVKKKHNILQKNTIFNEHPVPDPDTKSIVVSVAILAIHVKGHKSIALSSQIKKCMFFRHIWKEFIVKNSPRFSCHKITRVRLEHGSRVRNKIVREQTFLMSLFAKIGKVKVKVNLV